MSTKNSSLGSMFSFSGLFNKDTSNVANEQIKEQEEQEEKDEKEDDDENLVSEAIPKEEEITIKR